MHFFNFISNLHHIPSNLTTLYSNLYDKFYQYTCIRVICCAPHSRPPQSWTHIWLHVRCTLLATPPATDHIPDFCPGLEVSAMLCSCLLQDLCRVPEVAFPSTHWNGWGVLFVPVACASTRQTCAFSVVGPSVWNGLPLALRLSPF